MIGIVNSKMGNLGSVKNSLDYLNIESRIVNSPEEIEGCDKLILPGVGAFGLAMEELNKLGFVEPIKKFAQEGKPLLGICLGMQLLMDNSEEHGLHQGLGLIKGQVLFFGNKIKNLPIPHMGWNNLVKKSESPLTAGVGEDNSFYFVHSFYCAPEDEKEILATSDYGFEFAACVGKGKIFGCQFHPEKSQKDGLQILKNFENVK